MAASTNKKVRLMSDEDILAKGYKEVTQAGEYNLKGTSNLANRKDFINNRYIPGGLYDPAIFGLVHNCKCYKTGVAAGQPPKTCDLCGITVYGTEEERAKVNGYYKLPYAVVSPVKLDNLITKMTSRGIYQYSYSGEKGNQEYAKLYSVCMASYDEYGRHDIDDTTNPDTIGLDALYDMPEYHISINKLLLIPSVFYRPCYVGKNRDTGDVELNMLGDTETGTKISALLQFIKFTDAKMPANMSMKDYAEIKFNFAWLMYCYHRGNQILSGGKGHEVRDLTRSTIESSIRATISPALDLKLNQIKVPRALAYHAIDEDIINTLMDEYGYTALKARQEVKNSTELANKVFEDIIEHRTVCLLWRNPTLHKYSVNAVYPVLWDEPSISIPIELCKSMNADFDGDQVGVAFITDPKEYKTISKMTADKLFYYEKGNTPLYLPEHEIVLGLYLASSTKESQDNGKSFASLDDATEAFMNNEIEYDEFIRIDERKETYGRFRLGKIIGASVQDLIGDRAFVKKDWADVISVINAKSDRIDRLKELREFGARVVTYHGMEVPFKNIYNMDDEKVAEILDSDQPAAIKKDNYNEYVSKSVKAQIQAFPETNIGDIVKAGARVKDSVLTEIYAPVLKVDKEGNTRIERQSMFEGITESTFINRSLDNRQVQQLKRGQVPLSGFITRQMVLSNSGLIYDAKNKSPDRVGLELTADEAMYRTTVDGKIVRTGGDRKVRVRSCLNHSDKKVYKDEVSSTYSILDGSNISINIATGFSEFMTQTALSLKHGRTGGSEFSGDVVKAVAGGRVVDSGSNHFLWIDRGIGQIDKYYVSKSSRLHCRIGDTVKRDQVIIELNKPTPEGIALGKIAELLGVSCTQEFEYLRRVNKKCLCFAPFDCTIKFAAKTNKNGVGSKDYLVLSNGTDSVSIELGTDSFDEILKGPEGTTFKKGERIATGVIDLPQYASYVNRLETFDIFRKQIKDIFPNEKIRCEVLEIIFKSIEKTMHVGRMIKSNRGDTDFMDRMYYGATSQAIKSYFKNSDEYKLDSSLMLSLLFPDEGEPEA